MGYSQYELKSMIKFINKGGTAELLSSFSLIYELLFLKEVQDGRSL